MKVRELVRAPSRSASVDLYSAADGYATVVQTLGPGAKRSSAQATDLANNPLVFGPIWKIALRIGALPIKVYEITDEGVRQENNGHPAYQLLRRPNPVLTRNLLVAHLVVDLLAEGRGAWLKVREGGDPEGPVRELWPIHATTLNIRTDPRTLIGGFTVIANGKEVDLRVEDVCYFRLLPEHNQLAQGVSPFSALARIAALGSSAIDAGTEMFDNALLGRVWVKLKRELSTRAFNRLQRQMRGIVNDKYAIPMLEEDAELQSISGPSDEVVMNALSASSKIIRETLGLPDDDSSTSFYKNAIQPVADAIEQELERSLMPEFDTPGFPEFAFRDELRGDPLQRAQLHQTRILSAQETPDEARRDENRAPLPGGAGTQAFVPLNLIPIAEAEAAGETPPKDSGGGLGGDEGKGTLASTRRTSMAMRARASYSAQRKREIERQAKAAANRLRGVLNKEAKAVKALLTDASRSARGVTQEFPAIEEILSTIRRVEPDVADVIARYMNQTGDNSAPQAAETIGVDEVESTVADRLQEVFAYRSRAVARRFTDVRGDRISRLIEDAVRDGTSSRDLAGQISEAYQHLSTNYVDGIARTEVAFAHEQAALMTWHESGVREIEVVFGGGPCSTGVCETNASESPFRLGDIMENVGVSFDGADAPPFHPGCTCFAVPHVEDVS